MSEDIPSEIKKTLRSLREIATSKIPLENPLIIKTNYYENIRILGEYNFFVYYAKYGHGKTHGVALKLYHEALRGELSNAYDVIVIQLRNIKNEKKSDPAEIMKKMTGVDAATSFLVSSLYIGLSPDRCGSRVESLCFSTFVDGGRRHLRIPLENVILGVKNNGERYLTHLVKEITRRTNKGIILVFDEFEEYVKNGRFVPSNQPIAEFLADLAKIMRALHDKGVRNLKVVLLVQEAVIPPAVWEAFDRHIKESGAAGVTMFTRIEPYPPRIYAEFVVEAINRLVNKGILKRREWIKSFLYNKYLVISELERLFVEISRIPPRMAFTIADEYIATLVEKAENLNSTRRINNFAELRQLLKDAYTVTMDTLSKLDEVLRLQYLRVKGRSVYYDKSSLGNKDNVQLIVEEISQSIFRCRDYLSSFMYSTYIGSICVEGVTNKKLLVDLVIAKLTYSSRSSPNKLAKRLAEELNRKLGELIEAFIIDKQAKINSIEVRIFPIVAGRHHTIILRVFALAGRQLESILKKKLKKDLQEFISRLSVVVDIKRPYILDEKEAIILYGRIVAKSSQLFRRYVNDSYDEIMNEIRNIWVTA